MIKKKQNPVMIQGLHIMIPEIGFSISVTPDGWMKYGLIFPCKHNWKKARPDVSELNCLGHVLTSSLANENLHF